MAVSEEQLREWVYRDVKEWFEAHGEPFGLQFLAQRYSRAVKLHGFERMVEFVEKDKRLIVRTNRKGARLVAPRDLLTEDYGTDMSKFWNAFGCPF